MAARQEIEKRGLSLQRYKSIVDSSADAVISQSPDGVIETWNQGAENVFGHTADDAIGKPLQLIVPPEKVEEELAILQRIGKGERVQPFETVRLHKSGKLLQVSASPSPVFDAAGNITGVATIARDVTDHKLAEERIAYLATHDALTGLPNRNLLYDRLSQALSMGRRTRDSAAILFLDLDGFKSVNDTFGHEAGDITLKEVAHRMLSCIRETDTLARIGGDEFAIILNGVHTNTDIQLVATKIMKWVGEDIHLGADRHARVGVSIGIALFPADGNEMDTLLNAADTAMYASKSAGKNCCTFFSKLHTLSPASQEWVDISGPNLTGHAGIDAQHLEIADMLNQFSAALHANDSHDALAERLSNVVAYVARHFAYEEQLMDQFQYPGTAPHKNAHQTLLDEVKSLETRFLQGGEEFVLQWLKDWLLGHIGSSDRQLSEFLGSHPDAVNAPRHIP